MIELLSVSKKYGDAFAVKDISMVIGKGELCVLIGPSGCGKSTTLKMINRMIEPSSGDILIDSESAATFRPELLRRRIGYVIQSVGLFPHMTVEENIAVVPRLLKWERSRVAARIAELLELVKLDPLKYREKYPAELSGGEAQRVGVARALAADPPILLMDEPFGAIDPLSRERLQYEFVKIQKELGKTVVFVTHDIDEAIRIADKIAILRAGELVQYDTPENILAAPANKFVHDFVGIDRALKRLSRFKVGKLMRPTTSIAIANRLTSLDELRKKGRFSWVTDENMRLQGWVELTKIATEKELKEALTELDADVVSAHVDTSLKNALSKMLEHGVKTLAVVDENTRLTGEIRMEDIVDFTDGGDST
ncbi:MAG: ABC transporter ATP-binding protein [Actinobacteria bacterium]|nr:ABC transporter ATP-binding protein [Actinomycetota bacterium]